MMPVSSGTSSFWITNQCFWSTWLLISLTTELTNWQASGCQSAWCKCMISPIISARNAMGWRIQEARVKGFTDSSWNSKDGAWVAVTSPDNCCHANGTLTSGPPCFTVSKKLSNLQWNCGETHPVCKFKTKLTFLACDELGPKLTPRRVRGGQRGIDPPEESSFCSANTGHPKVCICLILTPIWTELKSSSWDVPSSRIGSMLWR